MTPERFDVEKEMTPEAREIISAYQSLRVEKNPEVQKGLCMEFYTHLLELLAAPGERIPDDNPNRVAETLIDGEGSGYIFLGSGTDGQRIFFKKVLWLPSKQKSDDGKVRWMQYIKPVGNSWNFGAKYWNKYMDIFGKETVDLMQDI